LGEVRLNSDASLNQSQVSEAVLIVFARYPVAGQAKTRLIPALGAAGAAQLYAQLAEHTLAQARQAQQPHRIQVHYVGAPVEAFQAWLGSDLDYCAQLQTPLDANLPQANLGDRMYAAFLAAQANGARRVVIIGTDCPHLDSLGLDHAFLQLNAQDLVLGPALDGGYYLIGLRLDRPGNPAWSLFDQIPWSTEHVFAATVAAAQQLSLAIAVLAPLADLDTPEDLARLHATCTPPT
jgi:uncharacterized protein